MLKKCAPRTFEVFLRLKANVVGAVSLKGYFLFNYFSFKVFVSDGLLQGSEFQVTQKNWFRVLFMSPLKCLS